MVRLGGVTQVSDVELSSAARNLAGTSGWWTVAYSLEREVRRSERIGQAVVVRGRRGEQRFMAVWVDGKADCAYWWTREHETVAQLPTEVVRWTSPVPTPVKVSFAELKKLVALPQM